MPEIQRIKVCLNGGRRRDEHPTIPITAEELAAAAAGAVAAGAEAIHLHPRDRLGVESLHGDDVAAAVSAVRRACPEVPVGVSTGLWICRGDVDRRLAIVTGWTNLPPMARPDFASVNLNEPGFADLVPALRRADIGVEAGVWSTADARALASTARSGWLRILVEIITHPGDMAVVAADAILDSLDELGVIGPRLLHGKDASCWPLIAHAGRIGLPTRIGLEDTTAGPAGQPVTDNADLIRRALALWAASATQR